MSSPQERTLSKYAMIESNTELSEIDILAGLSAESVSALGVPHTIRQHLRPRMNQMTLRVANDRVFTMFTFTALVRLSLSGKPHLPNLSCVFSSCPNLCFFWANAINIGSWDLPETSTSSLEEIAITVGDVEGSALCNGSQFYRLLRELPKLQQLTFGGRLPNPKKFVRQFQRMHMSASTLVPVGQALRIVNWFSVSNVPSAQHLTSLIQLLPALHRFHVPAANNLSSASVTVCKSLYSSG